MKQEKEQGLEECTVTGTTLKKARMRITHTTQTEMVSDYIAEACLSPYVLVFYPSKMAFEEIPQLNILKRDNYKTYSKGLESEYTFVEFNTEEELLEMYLQSFNSKELITYVFMRGELKEKI